MTGAGAYDLIVCCCCRRCYPSAVSLCAPFFALHPPRRRAELLVAQAVLAERDFSPAAFEKELVKFAETEEYIVRGGRDKFKNLPKAMQVGG